MSGFDVGTKHVGDGAPCLIVAEVAQAHEGSLQMAHAYIDAIAGAGADAVKFQCHIAEAESTPDEPWRVEPRWKQDESRYAYWERMEFSEPEWRSLADHCNQRGLIFLCSPFSVEAVKLLDPFVPAWKVPSGEITNWQLLEAIGKTEKPVILSGGMGTLAELARAIKFVTESGSGYDLLTDESRESPIAVLTCRSIYPTPPELQALRQPCEPCVPVPYVRGLSDHSGTIYAGLAAVALGCDVLEVHVKLSDYDQGFDASSSITIDRLYDLVAGVRFIEKAKQPVDKDQMARELEPMRRLFMDKHKRRASSVNRTINPSGCCVCETVCVCGGMARPNA